MAHPYHWNGEEDVTYISAHRPNESAPSRRVPSPIVSQFVSVAQNLRPVFCVFDLQCSRILVLPSLSMGQECFEIVDKRRTATHIWTLVLSRSPSCSLQQKPHNKHPLLITKVSVSTFEFEYSPPKLGLHLKTVRYPPPNSSPISDKICPPEKNIQN